MSKIIMFKDHVALMADYNSPEIHKHLASHIIISLGKEMYWKIGNDNVTGRGICINSNIPHTGVMRDEGAIVFLFTQTSKYAMSLNDEYFKENPYVVLDDFIVDKVVEEYRQSNNIMNIDEIVLNICGLNKFNEHEYDKRIESVLKYIREADTIEQTIFDDICNKIYLSKSRLSHLFKKETGMTLHSYLALEKIKKTYAYIENGMNITDACLLAGFDSSSHFSATCKRMFGISLRDVKKTIKDSI